MARQLAIREKTGFKVNDVYQPIVIRDNRGVFFFSNEDNLPRCTKFNLPAGEYLVDTGYFSPMAFPVRYPRIKLPFPQRFLPSSANFTIIFASEPNKCRIIWDKKTIIFDLSFKEKPLYEVFGVRFHEEGHKRYDGSKYGESCADLFAVNKLLDMGFNPLQCAAAFADSLSGKVDYRKINVIKKLFQYVV